MLSVDVMLNSRWLSSDHWLTAFRNSSPRFWSGAPRNSIIEADYTDSTEKNQRRLEYQRLFVIRGKKKKSWAATQSYHFLIHLPLRCIMGVHDLQQQVFFFFLSFHNQSMIFILLLTYFIWKAENKFTYGFCISIRHW